MIKKLVAKNLRANNRSNMTFVLSNAVVYAIIFVLYSLTKNEYVLTRHEHLASLMNFGAIVLSAIAVVFTLYSQRFYFKKRSRELSLYQVLGLEKKHLVRMLGQESLIIFVITSILTTITGYVIGVISFLLLRKILNFSLDAFSIFEFNIWALAVTIGILALSFILNLVINVFSIASKTPTELIAYEKTAEKEPKVNILLLITGLISLGSGYYLALNVTNPMEAITWVFVAIIFVIVGTYCLFTSLSILFLKLMRKNKRYYFKKENFLSISNLLYRLKSNGVSLATITILCSAVILTISASASIGQVLQNMRLDNDYELTYKFSNNYLGEEEIENELEKIDNKLDQAIDRKYFINYNTAVETMADGTIDLDFDPSDGFTKNTTFFTATTKDYYEKAFGEKLDDLKDDEIYYFSSNNEFNEFKEISIAGKTYQVRPIEDKSDKSVAMDRTFIVTQDFESFQNIVSFSRSVADDGPLIGTLGFNMLVNEKEGEDLSTYLKDFAAENTMAIASQKEQWEFLQGFSGGFFFLGILLSIILTIITSLVLYYKQISEAEEDKKRYEVLRKLGVSEKMATKTIQRQMGSVFLSPIIVAVIHNLFASKIMATMLRLFFIHSYWIYFRNFMIVSAVFVIVYLIAYKMSQRAYKNIVWKV